jgi:glycosyltransferase involved in cell wall biosynthesis
VRVKVSVDIQAAIAQRAGIGRYVQCLAEHLGAFRGTDALQWFYFDFRRRGHGLTLPGGAERAVRWVPGRVVQGAWKTLHFPPYNWFAGAADVYHFTNFIRPPLTRGASVVSIYDVSFLRYPDAAEPANLAYLRAHIGRTVRRADAIITISAFSKQEIVALLGADPGRVHAIYPGVNHERGRPDAEAIRDARAALRLEGSYLLFVGTLEPRKNIPLLVDAFGRLRDYPGALVLAGMRGWKTEPILAHIARSPARDRIRVLDYVPDRHLPALYAGADLFVFPSRYEGFGFPPLEAMTYGVPVVSSTGGSLPEVLGDAAALVPEEDPAAWAETLASLLADPDRRAALAARGRTWPARYTWEHAAEATWAVYRQVAR